MKSWEFTDEQKREIQKQQREIGLQFDPETGRCRGEGENTGDDEDVEGVKSRERCQEKDGDIR